MRVMDRRPASSPPQAPEAAGADDRTSGPTPVARRRMLAASGVVPAEVSVHLTPGEAAALAALGLHMAEGGGLDDAGAERIMERAGVRVNTLRAALTRAQEQGLVVLRDRRRPPGAPEPASEWAELTALGRLWVGAVARGRRYMERIPEGLPDGREHRATRSRKRGKRAGGTG